MGPWRPPTQKAAFWNNNEISKTLEGFRDLEILEILEDLGDPRDSDLRSGSIKNRTGGKKCQTK